MNVSSKKGNMSPKTDWLIRRVVMWSYWDDAATKPDYLIQSKF